MKPFVKWAGGKRQILDRIKIFIDESKLDSGIQNPTYFEPFLGGGAVLISTAPKKACVNDLNSDLINAYKVIQSEKVFQLISLLKDYQNRYQNEDRDELYYETRGKDRINEWNRMTDVEKAARMIFLNRTCYNGLYRVNNQGQFNTPIGRYRNPLICDEQNLIELHEYLSKNKVKILNCSYEECISKAKAGDIIYVDPPYDYEDDDGFTKYQMSGFTFEDFVNLKKVCDRALKRGAYIIISNNATERIIKLFSDDAHYKIYVYDMNKFETLRSINCKGESRRTGSEVIFWGIPSLIPLPQANDISKVIRLAMADKELLQSKDKLKEFLGVTSERQVSYYLSALKFFGYINNGLEFTQHAESLRDDEKKISNDMRKQLTENEDIRFLLENDFDTEIKITMYLKTRFKKLSDSTANRRASTIKSWINWIKQFDLFEISQ